MVGLHQWHLLVLALWGGVVLAESVIELLGRQDPDFARPAAVLHYYIDLLIELPLIVAVLATGAVLWFSADRLTAWHGVKLAAALAAVSANLYCIVQVVKRRRALAGGADSAALAALTKRVFWSAFIGFPFAATAAGLGLVLTLRRFQELGIIGP